MSSLKDTGLPRAGTNTERFWDHARRQAALQELEQQFNLRLSEAQVFQAATLFFSLLAEGSFANKEMVVQEVHRQLLTHMALVPEAKKSST